MGNFTYKIVDAVNKSFPALNINSSMLFKVG